MKMPSLDSASIKRFFLYHCEKLILVLSIVLLGLFFWFGYSTPTFEKATPTKMVENAKSANRYMNSNEAWSKIADLRQGDDEVVDRIMQVANVEPTLFDIGPASYPVKRDSLRRDIEMLASPFSLALQSFVAPTLIQPRKGRVIDPLVSAPPVSPKLGDDDDKESDSMMGPGMGMSGGPGMGMSGGPGMGMGDSKEEKKSSRKKRVAKEEDVDAGTFVSTAVEMTMPGIRNVYAPTTVKAYNFTGVAVTGHVDHKKMWQTFKSVYSSSLGYHPDRDTPLYDFVQVERRVVGDDGTPGEWNDISELLDGQREFFPNGFDTAPEVVGAKEHDGILTMPILPFAAGFDYKPIAMHPSSIRREFVVAEVEEEEVVDGNDIDMKKDDEDENLTNRPGARRRGSAIGGGRSGGGLGMGGPGGSMGGPGGMGGSMGGPGGMGGGMGGPGMGGMKGSKDGGRIASDYSDYETDVREEPTSDYKVLRFFDIHGVRSDVTYQYRVRVWIRDPNNEDPDLAKQVGGTSGDGMGMGGMEMGGMGGGMGMGMGMSGGKGGKGGEDEEKMKEKMKFAKKTAIANIMIHPAARERLGKAREEKKDGVTVYYVSERQTNAAGETEWVEIQVPKNKEFLRFARPTMWSEIQEITVDATPTFVYAGEPVKTRRIEVGRGTVADGEPSMRIATGKMMQLGEYAGVKIPFKAEVKAGDLLDFSRPSHVLHPVTREVRRVTDAEVRTSAVVIDVAEGEELKFKKSSPIPYYYPGEVLVMNSLGKIELRNDLDDRGNYIATMLERDETASYGKKRRAKKKSKEEMMGGMGMGGMGGMEGGGNR